MARSDLFSAAKNAKQVYEMIQDVSEDEGLEGWVQEKIIKANDYLNTIREYLEGKQIQQEASSLTYEGKIDFAKKIQKNVDKSNKAVVKTKKEVGARIADIGAGGKEHNVKTDKAWDDAQKAKKAK
jgi:predicted NodU family carbamoyl transferase